MKSPPKKALSTYRIMEPNVAAVFRSYPKPARDKLREIRRVIIETADKLGLLQDLDETLKWGEPAYLVSSKIFGSTVRIHWKPADPERVAIYFKCTANLVDAFRKKYPDLFTFHDNRCISFRNNETIPDQLCSCIALAMTYHLNKALPSQKRWNMVSKALKGSLDTMSNKAKKK